MPSDASWCASSLSLFYGHILSHLLILVAFFSFFPFLLLLYRRFVLFAVLSLFLWSIWICSQSEQSKSSQSQTHLFLLLHNHSFICPLLFFFVFFFLMREWPALRLVAWLLSMFTQPWRMCTAAKGKHWRADEEEGKEEEDVHCEWMTECPNLCASCCVAT